MNDAARLDRVSEFVRTQVVPKIPAHEPRLGPAELATAVVEFCEGVEEFWAWCPTVRDLVEVFDRSPSDAERLWDAHWDHDFVLLRGVVESWPPSWPAELLDLHAAALEAGIRLPRNDNLHHPAADARWGVAVLDELAESGYFDARQAGS
ncbi:MAG: hypothetical protein F6K10_17520 [Moorea sp. SIO2B7]|nr:hypothetical protein [Moorena sp. SIO2B7]